MRRYFVANIVLWLVVSSAYAQRKSTAKPPAAVDGGISVWFSPEGGAEAAIVNAIDDAKKSVDVLAYYFTNSTIAKALASAHQRGVKVRVVLDHSQETIAYSGATYLANQNVPTYVDAEHNISHNKVMLIDGGTIITGSFNFTRSAETENTENLLIITGRPKLYAAYAKNFAEHFAHARPYKPPAK
jgi:phosphatidylserine/phosphatidylglycerophosphate/cardiolipin synthase-like enzyme